MATTFPASLDAFTNITNPTTTTLETEVGGRTHSEFHNDYNDAIEALETKVGADGSGVTSSLTFKIAQLEAGFPSSSVDSEIALFSSTTGKVLKRATNTGLLKATSGVLSTATAGTDYIVPGVVTGTGITMSTARILGRTTASTGAIEEISVGAGLGLSGGTLSLTSSNVAPTFTVDSISKSDGSDTWFYTTARQMLKGGHIYVTLTANNISGAVQAAEAIFQYSTNGSSWNTVKQISNTDNNYSYSFSYLVSAGLYVRGGCFSANNTHEASAVLNIQEYTV